MMLNTTFCLLQPVCWLQYAWYRQGRDTSESRLAVCPGNASMLSRLRGTEREAWPDKHTSFHTYAPQ